MSISLIANSGIQFHKFDISIDANQEVIKSMGFHECLEEDMSVSLQYAYYLPNLDIWVPKKLLKEQDYLDELDKPLQDKINIITAKSWQLKPEQDYYTIGDIDQCLSLYASKKNENKWIPIPYFKKNSNQKSIFGPTAWARMMILEAPQANKTPSRPGGYGYGRAKTYKVILAFDTKVDDSDYLNFSPKTDDTNEGDNFFALSDNEDLNLNFCNHDYNCGWVSRYLKYIWPQTSVDAVPNLKHLASYLYFIKYLHALHAFPEVTLFTDIQSSIEVDLVLDIGNANTCGILFETPSRQKPFDFSSVKMLKLHDLSQPDKDYNEPFAMRLVFVDTNFGDIDIPQHRNFCWPSLLRVGKEAARLINDYNIDPDKGVETATNYSSPKRYLWDDKKTEVPWQFINFKGQNIKDAIAYEGITEQFLENGEYAFDGNFACSPNYSRKSLMTFVYIEILLHAMCQINSFEFRATHGNPHRPRKIKRITITCPTSIIQKEQVVLRESALTAVRTLDRFFLRSYGGKYEEENDQYLELEIIPRPKDVSKNLDQLAFRKDWIYDEATCGQLVFLYAEISKRYQNNAELFFNLFGKKRDDVSKPDKQSLTIGSIDIGGGTTDLMICAYQYEGGQNLAVLKPHPLYWESFNLAGDELLKEIVQQIILEGPAENTDGAVSIGGISNSARKKGVTNVPEKMLSFFGHNSNSQGFARRMYRKSFIVQVAIPIAQRYLQHAIENKPDTEVSFNDLFTENKPNAELLSYFNQHFSPLKFEDIRWKLSTGRVNEIVEKTFDTLIKQLSTILSAYGCDYVLLAGKPSTTPKLREMFVKYFPVPPERLITLNTYRIGRWYPFADDIGYITDPKTLVAVGALIALMGDKLDRLAGFRLDTQLLRKNLISTCDYIGLLNQFTGSIDEIFLSPEQNSYELKIHTLPIKLGYKQLPNASYRGKAIYKLEFNEEEIKRRVLEQNMDLHTEHALTNAIDNFKTNLKNNMPFSIRLQRTWAENRENVTITRLTDANGNDRSRQLLSLTVMTLADEYSYWLDTGEFVLNFK